MDSMKVIDLSDLRY